MLNIRFLHLPLFVPDLARYSGYHLTQHVCTASDTTEAVRVEKNGNYVLQQLGQVIGGEFRPTPPMDQTSLDISLKYSFSSRYGHLKFFARIFMSHVQLLEFKSISSIRHIYYVL